MTSLTEHSSWKTALEHLQQARVILLLGASDTGKTTFLTWLANTFQARGQRIAIIDADVGQSSLGPPTTIGLGVVTQSLQRLQELTPSALYFVGSTSPRGHLLPMVVGTRRMADRAQTLQVEMVIIDTCGFIGEDGGQSLKHAQIDVVNPDVLVCLQRAHECESILRAFRHRQRPRILRLQASHASRRRSMEERRVYRKQVLQRYFATPQLVTLSWDDLNLIEAPLWGGAPVDLGRQTSQEHLQLSEVLWAERRDGELRLVTPSRLSPDTIAALERAVGMRIRAWPAEELHGTLLGLLDSAGETLGIGVLRHIRFACRHLEILTAKGIEGIAGIRWSRTRMGPGGELQRVP